MAESGPSADGGRKRSTQRQSTAASPVSSHNEQDHWHSIVQNNCPVRFKDQNNTLSRLRPLQATDVILLLTPVVPPRANTPDDEIGYDPYEYLGRALWSRHHKGEYIRRHGLGEDLGDGRGEDLGQDLDGTPRPRRQVDEGAVAHISYTDKNLITTTHRGIMKSANFVIVVANNNSDEAHPHFGAANQALVIDEEQFDGDERGFSVVLTNNTPGAFELYDVFKTVIQTQDYSKESLDAIAGLIFGDIRAGTESPNPGLQ